MNLQVGVALLTGYDTDGFMGVQYDAFGEERSGMAAAELHHPYGFASRCLDPANDNTGCALAYAFKGSHKYAWLLNDPRVQDKIPPLKKGASAHYASDGSFAVFDPETHTWTLYSPYEFDGDGNPTKAHVTTHGRDGNGKPIIELASGEGPAVTILQDVITIKNASGNAWVQVDNAGTTIVGPLKAHGGADLGGTASQPLTKFAPLQAWAAAAQAALSALAGISANSAASPAVAAAATALSTLGATGPTVFTKGA